MSRYLTVVAVLEVPDSNAVLGDEELTDSFVKAVDRAPGIWIGEASVHFASVVHGVSDLAVKAGAEVHEDA